MKSRILAVCCGARSPLCRGVVISNLLMTHTGADLLCSACHTSQLILCFVSVVRWNFPDVQKLWATNVTSLLLHCSMRWWKRRSRCQAHVKRMASNGPCGRQEGVQRLLLTQQLIISWSSFFFSPDCAILPGYLWRQIALSPYPSVEAFIRHLFLTWYIPTLHYPVVAEGKSKSPSETMLYVKVFGKLGIQLCCRADEAGLPIQGQALRPRWHGGPC